MEYAYLSIDSEIKYLESLGDNLIFMQVIILLTWGTGANVRFLPKKIF